MKAPSSSAGSGAPSGGLMVSGRRKPWACLPHSLQQLCFALPRSHSLDSGQGPKLVPGGWLLPASEELVAKNSLCYS